MRKFVYSSIVAAFLLAITSPGVMAERVVILHTNDTHSQIDPDKNNLGGILRRKVLIDSVRRVEQNVVLVDAGDAVQGSLFFTLFDGEVEQKMMNELGYDIQILGNHEFDNGIEKLAAQYADVNASLLSTNYDFTGTLLQDKFVPYVLRRVGDKRIAFIGVNVRPQGLIDSDNYPGVTYFESIPTANAMAEYLKKNLAVDKVIALTHIGYNESSENDPALAASSEFIDIIIGGHSHSGVYPGNPDGYETVVTNKVGAPVQIAQMGKSGLMLGEIVIDFDKPDGEQITSRAIAVDSSLDRHISASDEALLAPYRHRVDSISAIEIGILATEMESNSTMLSNFLSDWVKSTGDRLAGQKVDFALLNKGGIRNSLPAGVITQGNIINMLPFNNRIVVVEISGEKLVELMDIIASQDGQAVSAEVSGKYDRKTRKMTSLKINGRNIDPGKRYVVATIDYLWRGGDNMSPLSESTLIARSANLLYRDLIEEFTDGDFRGKTIKGDSKPRLSAVR